MTYTQLEMESSQMSIRTLHRLEECANSSGDGTSSIEDEVLFLWLGEVVDAHGVEEASFLIVRQEVRRKGTSGQKSHHRLDRQDTVLSIETWLLLTQLEEGIQVGIEHRELVLIRRRGNIPWR